MGGDQKFSCGEFDNHFLLRLHAAALNAPREDRRAAVKAAVERSFDLVLSVLLASYAHRIIHGSSDENSVHPVSLSRLDMPDDPTIRLFVLQGLEMVFGDLSAFQHFEALWRLPGHTDLCAALEVFCDMVYHEPTSIFDDPERAGLRVLDVVRGVMAHDNSRLVTVESSAPKWDEPGVFCVESRVWVGEASPERVWRAFPVALTPGPWLMVGETPVPARPFIEVEKCRSCWREELFVFRRFVVEDSYAAVLRCFGCGHDREAAVTPDMEAAHLMCEHLAWYLECLRPKNAPSQAPEDTEFGVFERHTGIFDRRRFDG